MTRQQVYTARFAIFSLCIVASFGAGIALGSQLGSTFYKDIPQGSYYDVAVGELVDAGIFHVGSDAKFRPGDTVNRAEMAVMFQRLRNEIRGVSNTPVSTPHSSRSSKSSKHNSSENSTSSVSSLSSSKTSTSLAAQGMFRFTSKGYGMPENGSMIIVSVVRTNSNKGTVSVDFATADGTAIAGQDYETISGTLTFAAGETSKNFQVKSLQDSNVESDETFTITLSNPTSSSGLGDPIVATITVKDDDGGGSSSAGGTTVSSSSIPAAGALRFSATEYSVFESSSKASVTIERVGGAKGAVTVQYTMADGTATTANYNRTNGSLSFLDGETSKTFTVDIYNNSQIEGNKTVKLGLTSPTGGSVLGTSSANLTIIDDETVTTFGTGAFRLSKSQYEVVESEGKASISVLRSGGAAGAVTVKYRTIAGSATSGRDFVETTGVLHFANGEAGKLVTVPLYVDIESDGGEAFSLELFDTTGQATLGTPSSSNVVIY